jgi:hypothetical protein
LPIPVFAVEEAMREFFINNAERNDYWQVVLNPIIFEIAKPYKVYALCIGSNFGQLENEYCYWTDVADFVRTNFMAE